MLRCDACGVVVTPPELRATEQKDYYETQYTLTHTVRADREMHRYFRYPEYISLIGDALRLKPEGGSWLDVGCDHGFFLDDARRHGFRVQGVEPAVGARNYASSIGLPVSASMDDVAGTFTVISFWHVLEHIADPISVLRDAYERLEPGGLLCIRVPDAGGFWSRLLRDRWIWFQPHHHVIHYTGTHLAHAARHAGFQIIELRHQRPNTRLTKRAYRLSAEVFAHTLQRSRPSLRDRAARLYQDLTGQELYLIARRP